MHGTEDNENPDEHPDLSKYHEVFREKMEGVEEAARHLGLYVRDAGITLAPGDFHDDPVRPVIVANFTVGDVAWSDRVQNPQQDTVETEFRKMAVKMDSDSFESLRDEMQKRLTEGKDIFDEATRDDDGDVHGA